MDASNAPVRRPRPEVHTDDIGIEQKPVIQTREDLDNEITVAPEVTKQDYLDALKFNEDPITIRVERSSEKFPPRVVDIWCNGKGVELLIDGKWVPTGAIPLGMVVTTKRKYVEILLKSKTDNVETDSGKIDDHSERNDIIRNTSAKSPLSVIEDRNPRGAAWLQQLTRFG